MGRQINTTKLHEELTGAGIPIDGVSYNNHTDVLRIDFQAAATPAQRTQAETIALAHTPATEEDTIKTELRGQMADYRRFRDALRPTDWNALTNQAKWDLIREVLVFVLKVCKLVLKQQGI